MASIVDDALAAVRRGTSARKLEGDGLEFKTEKDTLKATEVDLCEAAVCMANGRGGLIVVGVRDELGGPQALIGSELDPRTLRSRIHQLSTPSLTCEVSVMRTDGVRLVVIAVPEGIDVHSTTAGRSLRRVGSTCIPLTAVDASRLFEERRGIDWSAAPSDTSVETVSARTLLHVRQTLRRSARDSIKALAADTDETLVRRLGVVTADGRLTRAGELTLGGEPGEGPTRLVYQYRSTPGSESSRVLRLAGPLAAVVGSALEAVAVARTTVPLTLSGGEQVDIQDYPADAVREAVVNALVHGDHRLGLPVQLDHSGSALVIESAGPLVGGVTPDNILTRGPRPRFPQLADVFLRLGWVEQLGAGVPRMFRDALRSGQDAPTIIEERGGVVVRFPGRRPDLRVARFIRTLPDAAGEDVDTLLILSALCRRKSVSAQALSPVLQRDVAFVQERLRQLSDSPTQLVVPTSGTSARLRPNYQLAPGVLAALGSAVSYHGRAASEIQAAVVAHVRDYGWINSGTVQRTFDVDVYRASHLLRELVETNVLVRVSVQTRGTAVRYGQGPKFPKPRVGRH